MIDTKAMLDNDLRPRDSFRMGIREKLQARMNAMAVSSLAHTPTCPRCCQTIPSEDVNVVTDVAFCRACNLTTSLSGQASSVPLDPNVDITSPPAGAWYRDDGLELRVGASCRSLGSTLGLLFISAFWNGIVSVFVVLAISATLHHIGVAQPSWFPTPKMNGSTMGVGMTLFLWLFLTPFILIGSAMIGALLTSMMGHTEVRVRGGEGKVFTGIGSIGFTKRFDATGVSEIRNEDRQYRDSDGDNRTKKQIVLEITSAKRITFGSMLRDDRRAFVASALGRVLLPRDHGTVRATA